ncbi:mobile mystery protein B [Anatilimnocola sp. NA78]|uniref:mobile mystery protein B n=1 Tax=Anatilimnocola sp. NA78 TaxID=3415683 RepID=UPI003CE4D70F
MTPFGPIVPGETPLDDLSGLKIKGITTRAELNIFEATNIEKVVARYLTVRPSRRSAKFTFAWCLSLHQEMFGEVWHWAGCQRGRELNLGIASRAIPENLAMLLDDLQSWPGFGIDFVEQAARLHHRAVQIHPFLNGNGRWARMLANIWLKHHRQPLTLWPETMIGATSEARAAYIAAIKQADEGNYNDLIAMHRQYAEASTKP